MKRTFLWSLFFFPLCALAFTIPEKPISRVSDFASMLSVEERSKLEEQVKTVEQETSVEIAVVTVPSLDGVPVESVAQDLFTKWGIGKKETNNGLLILVSLGDRVTRIQTGYGVEALVTDIEASSIQRDLMTPAFREGRYYDGLSLAVGAVGQAVAGEFEVSAQQDTASSPVSMDFMQFLFILVVVGLQIFGSILTFMAKTKSVWFGGIFGLVFGGILSAFVSAFVSPLFLILGLGLFGFLFDALVSHLYGRGAGFKDFVDKVRTQQSRGGMWGGMGGGSSSGGGGGFGGFSGGSSGGGGASGRW